jgi:phosphoglycolate phosphatase
MQRIQQKSEARVEIEPDFVWDGQDAYLFDIDGTLMRSRDRVHYDSVAASVQRVTGFEITLAGVLIHGSTDTAILREACRQAGFPTMCWKSTTTPFLRRCGTALPSGARIGPGADAGVEEVLHYLAQKGALLGVASGNLEAIGWIKIEKAGLREWFRFGGFSDHFPVRPELIGHAARKARELASGRAKGSADLRSGRYAARH